MLVLGSKRCNECGMENSLRLELREGGLWYHCPICGFEEYAWSLSEDHKKLQSILDEFRILHKRLPPCVRRIFYRATEGIL